MIGKVAAVLGVTILSFLLVNVVYELPQFGTIENRELGNYFLWHGLHDTGSANIVNAIVWDFRGFDTMGEETVLFSAAIGIFLILRRKMNGSNN